jgi:uncharacterized protein
LTFDTFAYLLGILAAIFMGLSKTGLPGVAILAIALLAEAFGENAQLSVAAMLPVLLVGDVFAVVWYRRHAQWSRLWGLFPYVAAGMVPGYLLLSHLNGSATRYVLGGMILALLALELARKRYGWTKLPGQWWFMALMGATAGFATVVGNAAGPVMTIYLLSRGLLKEEFIGTNAWFFFLVNLSKVVPTIATGLLTLSVLRFDLVILPATLVGAVLGVWLLPRIPQRLFNAVVLSLTAIAAVWLIAAKPHNHSAPRREPPPILRRSPIEETKRTTDSTDVRQELSQNS